MNTQLPILYSFRRCPYAMRARMAIAVSGQPVELREVVLRDKPSAMLEASAKGTVPVLLLADGQVLDESLDIMMWALNMRDPELWLLPEHASLASMQKLISVCDGSFKHHLDRFKYATRYADADPAFHRDEAGHFLLTLNQRLSKNSYLFGDQRSIADIAIFPFVRQFSGAAGEWFQDGRFAHLVPWLDRLVASDLFKSVMYKYPQWHDGVLPPVFPKEM